MYKVDDEARWLNVRSWTWNDALSDNIAADAVNYFDKEQRDLNECIYAPLVYV